MLLVTGLELTRTYRPTASRAWSDLYAMGPPFTRLERVRDVHTWTSTSAILTALAGAALSVASAIEERLHVRARAIAAPALGLLVAAASFTGTLLPWDQLALWAVTVGTNMDGYWFVVDSDEVRFVLVDGAEVGVQTFARWFWAHVAVLPVATVATGVALWRALRGRPARVAPEEGEQALLG